MGLIQNRDALLEDAAIVVMSQRPTTIQRKLEIGYARAGRIIDQLGGSGIVGLFW